ncbi:glutamate synthase-related protein [Methanothermobacter sp.]|uniref:glutamate synthase-related protein n=1 Tax=Methanothermobacter sp. TaxID=1884223 RepID=UPI002618F2BB|nr:glutamate synthase-related protein [Methanothermobacter sp.]MDI9615386.1 glutamate synthase-related protein [Methanothermobacter sp.]
MKEQDRECLCPDCPSYPGHGDDEMLFCARGSSRYEVNERGCLCASCPVYQKYGLRELYFCNTESLNGIRMRREGRSENHRDYMNIIHIKEAAGTGEAPMESMGSQKRLPVGLDDIHFVPAQVSSIPLNAEDPVKTEVTIGKMADKPLELSSPLMISGMSYGAVSKNTRMAIASAAARLGIGFNSGEGGVLEYEMEKAGDYLIVQYSTGRFGVTEDILQRAAAIEIRFGQGAYPGKGSYLPADKITGDVARVRGLKEGEGSYSPAHHPDIRNPEELREKVSYLRELSGGSPVGAKIGCGNVEDDVKALLDAGVDFIALDGFGGGTGAVNPHIRDSTGIPLIAAIPRAAKVTVNEGLEGRVSLIAGGGLRTGADMAKCLALGADAVYIGTAALIAMNCQQHRLCHTGMCPTGITTHDPTLVKHLDARKAAERLENYIKVSTAEIADFARITGKDDIKKLNHEDLVALKKDVAELTGLRWLNGL